MNGILASVMSTVVDFGRKAYEAVNSPEGRCALAAAKVQTAIADMQDLVTELTEAVDDRAAALKELDASYEARVKLSNDQTTRYLEAERMILAGDFDQAVSTRYETMTAPAAEVLDQADAAAAADDTE